MYLAKLTVENFRGIEKAEIDFGHHTVIIGPNNAGKSSIVDAIALLLGREKLAREIGDYDFFGGNPQPADRIKITGILTGFLNNNLAESPEWFNENDGGIPCWYSPTTKQVQYGNSIPNSLLAVEIGFCARFNKEDLEFETLRYFVNGATDPFEDTALSTVKAHRHLAELGFFLVPSKRMWDKTMSFGSDLFNKVLRFQDAIPGTIITELRDTLRATEEKIENEEPLKTIVGRLNNELQGFLNAPEKNISFLPTSGDIAGVLHCLTPFIQGQRKTEIPISKHGSGLISLQTLLLLLEFGRYRNETGKNFFLIAEEPELHLNQGVHKRLISRIRGLSHQSITTTHSHAVSSFYKPEEILILNNKDGIVSSKVLSTNTQNLPNPIMRLFTLYRAEVCDCLMHDTAIVPEGATEYSWFRLLINACSTAEGWDVYNLKDIPTKSFGIFPTQSSAVVETYKIFQDFNTQLLPIVDGDKAGNGYVIELLALPIPPKIILQLGSNWILEDMICWLISPDPTKIAPSKIAEIENQTEPMNGASLRDFLIKFKSHWMYHEAIVHCIIQDSNTFTRAQQLLNSIYSIRNLPAELVSFWKKDNVKSTSNTQVFVFQNPTV
jgi:putative ATP-dependent endonuclease of the OLD family